MKTNRIYFLLAALLIFAFSSFAQNQKPKRIKTEDKIHSGLSKNDAVIIDAKGEKLLTVKAKEWISKKYPGYTLVNSGALSEGKKQYNTYEIQTTEGSKITLYFDVSNFYIRQLN